MLSHLITAPRLRRVVTQAVMAAAVVGLAAPVLADEHFEHRDEHREGFREGHEHGERFAFHEHYRGGEFRFFNERDMGLWRGGRWANTCYGGRCGWWWLAGGFWYFYDHPIYPYPLIVSDYYYAEPVAVPPVVAAPVAPPPPPPPPAPRVAAPPPAQNANVWYYCDNPPGYYPYVQSCPSQFRAVPANSAPPR
jgi:hypothetical protein